MPQALYPLLLLVCPISMGLMMWLMMARGHRESKCTTTSGASATQAELEALREEIQLLRSGQAGRAPEMFQG